MGFNSLSPFLLHQTSFDSSLLTLHSKWSVAHTRCRCDGRQEGGECGYYHLHRNLNEAMLLHSSPPFRLIDGRTAVVVTSATVVATVAAGVATIVTVTAGCQGTCAATRCRRRSRASARCRPRPGR